MYLKKIDNKFSIDYLSSLSEGKTNIKEEEEIKENKMKTIANDKHSAFPRSQL